ncbi:MAG TPA: YceI family protein [Chryseolinea sp.]|nr:YceI family protein [Chryseolinea sp.]
MQIKRITILLILAVLFAHSEYSNAQVSNVSDYKVTIKGTSTMHDWESNVEELESHATYKLKGDELVSIGDASLKVTVTSIKSTKGKIMDNKTYKAFDSENHPFIIFTLKSEKINPSKLTVDLIGTLEMAGTTLPVKLVANYKVLANGELEIIGTKKVKMSEYKMTAPKAMMGTIKVGDEVDINFDVTFSGSPSIL